MSLMGRIIVIAIFSKFDKILQIIDKCEIKSVMIIKSDEILRNL